MTLFRVHFADAETRNVEASTPKEAGDRARAEHDCIITKVKVIREEKR